MSEEIELAGSAVVLRPLRDADIARLDAIRRTPEVARWWQPGDADGWPEDDPDAVLFTIVIDGEVAGLIQYSEETNPDYRHASIDVFLSPACHGRGFGSDAVRTLARYLIGVRGHHRITIDPAADNFVAIRCYEKAGFRPVGVMRQYERDHSSHSGSGWRDGLLMDLLADELS